MLGKFLLGLTLASSALAAALPEANAAPQTSAYGPAPTTSRPSAPATTAKPTTSVAPAVGATKPPTPTASTSINTASYYSSLASAYAAAPTNLGATGLQGWTTGDPTVDAYIVYSVVSQAVLESTLEELFTDSDTPLLDLLVETIIDYLADPDTDPNNWTMGDAALYELFYDDGSKFLITSNCEDRIVADNRPGQDTVTLNEPVVDALVRQILSGKK